MAFLFLLSATLSLVNIFSVTQAKSAIYRARTILPQGMVFNLETSKSEGQMVEQAVPLSDLDGGTQARGLILSFADPEMSSDE